MILHMLWIKNGIGVEQVPIDSPDLIKVAVITTGPRLSNA